MTGDSAETIPDRGELKASYDAGRPGYARILNEMERRIKAVLEAASLRPIIKGRIKSFDSWYAKRLRLLRQSRISGQVPLDITDVVALRAVCPFLGDLSRAERALCAAFAVVDVERKGSERSFREFGYESIHLLIELPEDLRSLAASLDQPRIEVQLRTILQEAWAEVEHEIVYKSEFTPFDDPMKRKLAALNANLSLSDIIFQEILDYQRKLSSELARRRANFHGKIEAAMDRPFSREDGAAETGAAGPGHAAASAHDVFGEGPEAHEVAGLEVRPGLQPEVTSHSSAASSQSPATADVLEEPTLGDSASLDDLLLAALMAHNREDYKGAGRLYSEILARDPAREIAAVVHKHRGMAYFAQSRYEDAIADFSASLMLDPSCYKAAYYRGVVRSVLQDYSTAVGDFDLALSIHPYHFYSRYRRGMAWFHLGDFPQALADSDAALRLEPGNAAVARLKALALEKLKM
ncbi:MAG TPA: tetratricopeptide repeat protein [Rectinemataceae bacterium]|nr:tetratricopeptide repeat protein [Rectinemataceae bacterium]